jgi:hypothetical protein
MADSSPACERFFLDNTGLYQNDSGVKRSSWTLHVSDGRLAMVRFYTHAKNNAGLC